MPGGPRNRTEFPISKLEGQTQGIKPSHLKALNRLYGRRYPSEGAFSTEQARELAALTRTIGRQLALIIDRLGRVAMVIVGDATSIFIPELPRGRSGPERLRGLRLLHTHLTPDLLSQEDLMDLLFLRLDGVAVLTTSPHGEPAQFQYATLLPPNPENKPYIVHPPMPWDKARVNFTAEAEALEAEMALHVSSAARAQGTAQRALLISVSERPHHIQERNLAELRELAGTAGLIVIDSIIQRVKKVNPNIIMGKGKMAELEVRALQGQASILIFDGELSPAQLHNLADLTERKVLDRTQLILDIFAGQATTRAGKLQVEMAQLKYTQPRLVGKNRAMDRLMGGIGGRGPGETKLETDRRRVRERIARIKKELDNLRRQRAFTRERRIRQGLPTAALVGYANAGKSTLLNALTMSDVLVEDKLFATLDPAARRLKIGPQNEIILTDTVGFIRNLPKELGEAFKATLEALETANLLIHVIDISHPDFEQQIRAVDDILAEMELGCIPRLRVFNKCDRLSEDSDPAALNPDGSEAIYVSAINNSGLDELKAAIAAALEDDPERKAE